MAKLYGDIPCVKINGIQHITISGTECLCGQPYTYGKPMSRHSMTCNNLIWRELESVTCETCRNKYIQKHSST